MNNWPLCSRIIKVVKSDLVAMDMAAVCCYPTVTRNIGIKVILTKNKTYMCIRIPNVTQFVQKAFIITNKVQTFNF